MPAAGTVAPRPGRHRAQPQQTGETFGGDEQPGARVAVQRQGGPPEDHQSQRRQRDEPRADSANAARNRAARARGRCGANLGRGGGWFCTHLPLSPARPVPKAWLYARVGHVPCGCRASRRFPPRNGTGAPPRGVTGTGPAEPPRGVTGTDPQTAHGVRPAAEPRQPPALPRTGARQPSTRRGRGIGLPDPPPAAAVVSLDQAAQRGRVVYIEPGGQGDRLQPDARAPASACAR